MGGSDVAELLFYVPWKKLEKYHALADMFGILITSDVLTNICCNILFPFMPSTRKWSHRITWSACIT
jgi:hypothetical protein